MLHTLRPASGSRVRRKRVARGDTTAGRGTKGQQSRTGKGRRFGFEGGQTPLLRRQPKLSGFTRERHVSYEPLNLATLEKKLDAGSYTLADLRKASLLRTKKPVKILGQGSVTKKFTLEAHAASKSAKDAIVKAGGSVTIIKNA